jgi:opacity protein-like surface antigen
VTDLKLKAEVFDYAFWQQLTAVGLDGLFLIAATQNLHFGTIAALDNRTYSRSPDRNGLHYSIGEYTRIFLANKKYELILRAAYIGDDDKNKNYDYTGWEAAVNFAINNFYKMTITPFFQIGQEYYDGPATSLESEKRNDTRITIGTSITYKITDKWLMDAMYSYTNNSSASELYTFRKHMITAGVAYRF